MIENRNFLTWSSLFILATSAIFVAIFEFSILGEPSDSVRTVLGFSLALPSALIAVGVLIDGVRSVIQQRRYGWLLVFALLSFAGAYLYGFLIASERDNVAY